MPQAGTYATPRLDLGVALEEYPLGNSAVLVADQVLPVFNVPKKTASFSVITRESILAQRNVKRSKGGAYSRDTFSTDDVSYACLEYGHEQKLDDDDREFYASDFDAEMIAVAMARDIVAREREIRVAAAIQNTTTWTGSDLYTDLGTDWDNVSSTPVNDVQTAIEKVRHNCGLIPNTMVISAAVVPWLKANTDIKARLNYVMAVTPQAIRDALSELFGIRVVVAGSITNTAPEGETYVGADIWDDNYAWIGVVPQSNSLAEPGAGRTLLWTGDSPSIYTVEEYREEQTRSWIYRCRQHVQEKIIDPMFAHLLKIDT